jgi:hypothetical protein
MEALGTPTLIHRRVSDAKAMCNGPFDSLTIRLQGTLTYRASSGVSEASHSPRKAGNVLKLVPAD